MKRYGEVAGRAVAGRLAAAADGQDGGRRGGAVKAFGSAARAHDYAAEAHERSIRTGVGDLAEHRRQAEFHRAAARADRQRAEEIERQAMAPPVRP
jgi:hypothetical protein